MRYNIKETFFTLAALIALFTWTGCKREKSDQLYPNGAVAEINTSALTECHNTENPYPSQITANIEGTWVWQSYRCPMTGTTTNSADKHVVLTFNDGGLFKVFEDSKLITEGEWNLSQVQPGIWEMQTSKPSEYVNGYIWLCKNELLFSSSYLDGCEYLFVKR